MLCLKLQERKKLERATAILDRIWSQFKRIAVEYKVLSVDSIRKGKIEVNVQPVNNALGRVLWTFNEECTDDEKLKAATLDLLHADHTYVPLYGPIRSVLACKQCAP